MYSTAHGKGKRPVRVTRGDPATYTRELSPFHAGTMRATRHGLCERGARMCVRTYARMYVYVYVYVCVRARIRGCLVSNLVGADCSFVRVIIFFYSEQ